MTARGIDDPAVIRAGIDDTRERISQDLDEIGERLNPRHVKDQVKDGIREATIGRVEDMAREAGDRLNEVSGGLVQTIKANPVPAAMAGVGLAWLFMSRGSTGARPQQGGYRYSSGRTDYEYNPRADSYEASQSRFGGTTEVVKDKVDGATEKAQELVSQAADTSSAQVRRLEDTFFENPVAVGLAVMAAGLAVGLVLPETAPERRITRNLGTQIADKVSDVAQETKEKAQHVADRAIEETKVAAREEGLTGTGGSSQQPML